ncbi:MAG: tetratricopeptide repeat protein [Candidatus Thorarchaeota archaeon]
MNSNGTKPNMFDQIEQTKEIFALWKSDKKQEAIQMVLDLVRKYPDNTTVLVLAAELLNEAGNTEASDEYIQKAIELDSEEVYNHAIKAKMLAERGMLHDAFKLMNEILQEPIKNYLVIEQAVMTYKKYGLLEMAEKTYQRGLEVLPDHEGFWHGYAEMYKKAYMLDKYLEVLQSAVKKRPSDSHLWSELGITAGILGKDEDAWDALETTQQLVHDDVEGFRKLGLLYQAVEQYGKAEEYLRKSVKKDDKNIHSWAHLALLLKLKGDEKGAKDAFKRAEKINKIHKDALKFMSERPAMKSTELVYAQNAESKFKVFLEAYKAREELPKLISTLNEINILVKGDWLINGSLDLLEPSLAREVLIFIGAFLSGKDDPDKALGALYKAIELSPNDPIPWGNLGGMLIKMGKIHGANSAYKSSISLDSSNVETKRALGYISTRLNNFDDAIRYLEETYSSLPDDHMVLNGLAYCYLSTGNYAKTKEFSTKILDITTSDAAAYGYLVIAEHALGNFEASDDALRMCKNLDKDVAAEYEKARASL